MFAILATETASSAAGMGSMLISMVLLFAVMYFLMIRPQQKEQKRKAAMLADLALGDTVLTTSGFYGTVIDIEDDTVIVEFGSNRNCRIPMQKAAISAVEKPEDAAKAEKEAAKPEKAAKSEKEKPEKAAKPEKASKSDKAEK